VSREITVAQMQEELAPVIFSLNNAKDTIKDICHTIRSLVTDTCGLTQEEFEVTFGKDENDPRWTAMIKIVTNYGNLLSDPRLLVLIAKMVNNDEIPETPEIPLDGGDSCPF